MSIGMGESLFTIQNIYKPLKINSSIRTFKNYFDKLIQSCMNTVNSTDTITYSCTHKNCFKDTKFGESFRTTLLALVFQVLYKN